MFNAIHIDLGQVPLLSTHAIDTSREANRWSEESVSLDLRADDFRGSPTVGR